MVFELFLQKRVKLIIDTTPAQVNSSSMAILFNDVLKKTQSCTPGTGFLKVNAIEKICSKC